MKRDLLEIIKEVSELYNVELKKVDTEREAGIFINIEGKKTNVAELDNYTIFNSIFNMNNQNFDYRFTDIDIEKHIIDKKLNTPTKNNQNFSFDFNFSFNKRKVA